MGHRRRVFDRWLFDSFRVSAASLAITRIACGLVVIGLVLPRWLWIAEAPTVAYHPPLGLASLLAAPPGHPFFVTLNIVAWVASVLLVLGAWTRTASCVLSASLVLGNSFEYAFGKIVHDILLALLPVAGAAANWGAALSWDARQRAPTSCRTWPLALFAMLIAIAMARSGLEKLASGWLDPGTAAVRTHLLTSMLPAGRATVMADHLLPVTSRAAWEVADVTAVLLEGSFAIAMLRRRWWIVACAVACVFHLANSLLFSIQFTANPMAYAIFGRWSDVPAMRQYLAGARPIHGLAVALAVAGATAYGLVRSEVMMNVAAADWPRWIGDVTFLLVASLAAIAVLTGNGGVFRPRLPLAAPVTDTALSGVRRVVFFDGYCGLCSRWVDFILRHDTAAVWKFAPLQSEVGSELLRVAGLSETYTDSIVVVEDGYLYTHSTAVIMVMRRMGGLFGGAAMLLALPTFLRDPIYWLVARVRYRVFGRTASCRMPSKAERLRFLTL